MTTPTQTSIGMDVIGTGAATCVGTTAPTSAAAVRAGVTRIAAHSSFVDRTGEPMVTATARYLPRGMEAPERCVTLAAAAALEALGPLKQRWKDLARIPVFLALLSARPGLQADRISQVRQELQRELLHSAP